MPPSLFWLDSDLKRSLLHSEYGNVILNFHSYNSFHYFAGILNLIQISL